MMTPLLPNTSTNGSGVEFTPLQGRRWRTERPDCWGDSQSPYSFASAGGLAETLLFEPSLLQLHSFLVYPKRRCVPWQFLTNRILMRWRRAFPGKQPAQGNQRWSRFATCPNRRYAPLAATRGFRGSDWQGHAANDAEQRQTRPRLFHRRRASLFPPICGFLSQAIRNPCFRLAGSVARESAPIQIESRAFRRAVGLAVSHPV